MKRIYNLCRFLNWWTDDVWYIGYRMTSQCAIYGKKSHDFYNLLRPTWRWWYADPIPFGKDGKYYIFMEVYDRLRNKGFIGALSINDQKYEGVNKPIKVIEEPFHMSFPYVFSYKDGIYMIPETNQVSQIRIYKMGESVYEWNLYHAYHTKKGLSDTIVLMQDEVLYLLNTEKNKNNPYQTKLHLWKIEHLSDKSELIEIPLSNSQEYLYNNRNGGRILKDKDKIYRIVQEAEYLKYGKDIVIREVVKFGDDGYAESEDIVKLEANKLPMKIKRKHQILGMHTYGYLDGFEVVDIKIRQLSYVMFRGIVQRNINRLKKRRD